MQTKDRKKDRKKEIQENQTLIDQFNYLKNAASTTDCTGLIPSLPQSDEELESYNNVYQYQTPLVKPDKSIP